MATANLSLTVKPKLGLILSVTSLKILLRLYSISSGVKPRKV